MNPFLTGFSDELVKTGGAIKSLGGLIARNPLRSAATAFAIGYPMYAGRKAYKEGLKPGEKGRYLEAGVDPRTGRIAASDTAYKNFHQLFKHAPSKADKKRLHGPYKPELFANS